MDERRKRLLYRATHRGTREADRLVGGFADRFVAELDAEGLMAFEALIEERDADLVDWLMGHAAVPAAFDGPLMRRMIAFTRGE